MVEVAMASTPDAASNAIRALDILNPPVISILSMLRPRSTDLRALPIDPHHSADTQKKLEQPVQDGLPTAVDKAK
jgi:hypothetical protein